MKHIRITAPDYRRPKRRATLASRCCRFPDIKEMTFENFETRDDEVGKEIVTTITKERQDRYGRQFKDKEIVREKVTPEHIKDCMRRSTRRSILRKIRMAGW